MSCQLQQGMMQDFQRIRRHIAKRAPGRGCAFPLGKGLAALFKAMKFPKPSPGDGALHKRQSGRACAVRMERYAVLSTG